jgi:hypothetical protein
MKRLLASAAIALATITSANAGCTDGPYSEEKENACNHGYATAAFEIVCPEMTVGDPALRAKLDAKYRNNPKMKKYFMEYYDLAAEQDKSKLTGVLMECLTASGGAKWIKWDQAVKDKLVADEKDYRVQKDQARTDDKNWQRAYFISVIRLYSKNCDGQVPADLQAWADGAVDAINSAILSPLLTCMIVSSGSQNKSHPGV